MLPIPWRHGGRELDGCLMVLIPVGGLGVLGEVDAILGYLLVLRRDAAMAAPAHAKARFYRNADMEWCLALREAGGRLVVPPGTLPVHQGRHHGYHDSDPDYRDRESRRTYDRLLQRFRGQPGILRPRS